MIYFDNCATTQTRKEVADFVAKYSVENFYNPSSLYAPAVKVKNDIDNARKRLLKLLNAEGNIIFTASATEANNMVINGHARKNKKILLSSGEHPSIFETAKNLSNAGFMVEFIKMNSDSTIDLEDLANKVDQNTNLVSVIHVSNETGAINDLKAITKVVKSINPECLVHADGVQAFGKLKVDIFDCGIDLYTMSSHKVHGPKGVGALYVGKNINLKPQIWGGGQENGIRPGTENPAGILGFTLASELMYEDFETKRNKIKKLKEYFIDALSKSGIKCIINSPANSIESVLSVSFLNVRGEVLLHSLEKYEIYVSTGSACSSKHIGNRVLTEMGLNKETMQGNIRFSFSEFNEIAEVDKTITALQTEIKNLLV